MVPSLDQAGRSICLDHRHRRVHGRRHRRRSGGVAGRVSRHRREAVRAVGQWVGGQAPAAGIYRRRAQVGRTVKHMHRRYAIGVAHRARQRQRIVLGQPAARDRGGRAGVGTDRRADRLARPRGIKRYRQRRGGRAIARRIGELRRDRLGAVGPEVARRHRQAHTVRRDVGCRNRVQHVVRQRRAAQQQLDRVAGRNRRIERHRERRAGRVGQVVGIRGARIRPRNQVRRAANHPGNTDHPVVVQVLVETGLERFQRNASSRQNGSL